jgi:hypothetical protein
VVGPSHEIRAFTPGGLRKELDVRMIWLAVWHSWFNLRPDEAIRGKWSINGWECRGVESVYSRLQGGSPCLCRLRTTLFLLCWVSIE